MIYATGHYVNRADRYIIFTYGGRLADVIKPENVSKKDLLSQVSMTAIDQVSLEISEGEFIVALVLSGSRKTTLLYMIGALDSPTSGAIYINDHGLIGAEHSDLRMFHHETDNFIFQTFNLFLGLTALKNVQFSLDVSGRKNATAIARQVQQQVLGSRLITSQISSVKLSGGSTLRLFYQPVMQALPLVSGMDQILCNLGS